VRRDARGPARPSLGQVDASLDDLCVDLSDHRHPLGSWWAYYELGWAAGGSGPVENASFMPGWWHRLIHSLSVTEKRGIFKSWTLLLAIFAFSLSLVGTFLVRSGVLVSVHSFATDPERACTFSRSHPDHRVP